MSLKIVTNKENASIKIEGEVTLRDELLYEVFNRIPEGDRETHLIKALKLGIHGYEIDEVATFISILGDLSAPPESIQNCDETASGSSSPARAMDSGSVSGQNSALNVRRFFEIPIDQN